MKKMIRNGDLVKIGSFGVDAGIVWIGDPCYILHRDDLNNELGKDWYEFCDILNEKGIDNKGVVKFASGMCIPTLYGDGEYEVFAELESGRVKTIVISFDYLEREEEEEEYEYF